MVVIAGSVDYLVDESWPLIGGASGRLIVGVTRRRITAADWMNHRRANMCACVHTYLPADWTTRWRASACACVHTYVNGTSRHCREQLVVFA